MALMMQITSLSAQVETALRKEIQEGEIQPGERIDLARYQKSWDVSITPLRDAVRGLEKDGLVTIEPRKGVFVSTIDEKLLEEIFELRLGLEGLAAELAARRIPFEIAKSALKDCNVARNRLIDFDDSSEAQRIDRLTHDLVRDYCGNSRLSKVIESHEYLFHWVQNVLITELVRPFEQTIEEHMLIIDALCNQDSEQAGEAMRNHILASEKRFKGHTAKHDFQVHRGYG
jgi:DNA-binding GntR family transcriptional regulator